MIEETNNLGRRVRVLACPTFADDMSQRFVGKIGVVQDTSTACPLVRFERGGEADCYNEELEYCDSSSKLESAARLVGDTGVAVWDARRALQDLEEKHAAAVEALIELAKDTAK